jgi:hypothetical protein
LLFFQGFAGTFLKKYPVYSPFKMCYNKKSIPMYFRRYAVADHFLGIGCGRAMIRAETIPIQLHLGVLQNE